MAFQWHIVSFKKHELLAMQTIKISTQQFFNCKIIRKTTQHVPLKSQILTPYSLLIVLSSHLLSKILVLTESMGVRDSNGVSKGGKCWFAVESMAFEISIEEVRGKLRGTIWERSKGLSSWIRFGEKGLSLLLEGVEVWCKGESNSRLLKVWDEETRKFRLERRSNVAGIFLLCSVRDVEGKKFCLVFPEGNG